MIRTILHYPDKRLREAGKKVEKLTPELLQLIDDMAETMYAAPGVGLAATQIGELLQPSQEHFQRRIGEGHGGSGS